jgi:phosphate transport system substrate-binding protein
MTRTVLVLLLAWSCSCAGPGTGTVRDTTRRNVIRITGSDTMVNLLQAWAERYARVRPDVIVQVAGGGSGVGIAGLIDGTLDIAAASRELRAAEREHLRVRTGAQPAEFTVARDALAVFVHARNPLQQISLPELADVYGEGGNLLRWSQLGIAHPSCASDIIIRVGRQNNSGTFAYFRDMVLGRSREYKMGSIDQSGSKDVVALVSRTPCAIGYSGVAYAVASVKAVGVAVSPDAVGVMPSEESVLLGSYPLARPLYLYTPGEATGHVKAFVEWVLGSSGQSIVRELGFVSGRHPGEPLPAGGD